MNKEICLFCFYINVLRKEIILKYKMYIMNDNKLFLDFLSKNVNKVEIIICFLCNLITHIKFCEDQPNCINSYYCSFHLYLHLHPDEINDIKHIVKDSLIDNKLINMFLTYNKKLPIINLKKCKSKVKYFNYK